MIKAIYMNILFCSNPLEAKQVDIDWQHEAELVRQLGGKIYLLNYEELIDGDNAEKALRLIKKPEVEELCIYRGWMMSVANYEKLYNSLLKLNLRLVNTSTEYKHCYYLPASYQHIEAYTAKTVITNKDIQLTKDELADLLREFGEKAIIVKDYVKSQKHHWLEACFIPKASDTEHVQRVVNKFVELQGDNLQGGLVFREFIELESVGVHPKSKMPLTKEYRVFILNKKPISIIKYWDEGQYTDDEVSIDKFKAVFEQVESNFFTVDIAKRKDGEWMIIELGDGQVAEHMGVKGLKEFYQQIQSVH